jgi:hypothetical protein
MSTQLVWLVAFEIWVLYIKPGSTTLLVGLQALIAQFIGLTALFIALQDVSLGVFVLGVTAICYFCSRHFFTGFNEENAGIYSWIWAFFSGSIARLLGLRLQRSVRKRRLSRITMTIFSRLRRRLRVP